MRSVNINKNDLLEIVKSNYEKHKIETQEAIKDYHIAVQKIAEENLAISKLPVTEHKFKAYPQAPRSYDSEYKSAIRMLELSVDTNITLESDEFDNLVLDEWSWKHSFTTANIQYKTLLQ